MRPGGKSNGESPFFETPNLSFEERVGNVAPRQKQSLGRCEHGLSRKVRPWRRRCLELSLRAESAEKKAQENEWVFRTPSSNDGVGDAFGFAVSGQEGKPDPKSMKS